MICLRCGYQEKTVLFMFFQDPKNSFLKENFLDCCKNCFVAVVDEPEKGPIEENLIVYDGVGIPCKHLNGNKPGNYSCAVHDYPWYKETPCFRHNSSDSPPDTLCKIGEYILAK